MPEILDPANPQPGLYPHVPEEVYHSLKLASASNLGNLKRSPAHCFEAMNNPKPRRRDLKFGSAVHFAVLEPDLFEDRYVIAERCEETLKSGARKGDQCSRGGAVLRYGHWYCTQHDPSPGKPPVETGEVMTQNDRDLVLRMRDAVFAHPEAREMLEDAVERELTGIWRDPDSGVLCKCRVDLPCEGLCVVGDLKTTYDARPDVFCRSMDTYAYHMQGAHYLRGMAALGRVCREFRPIAVEKELPIGVEVYTVSKDDLCRGMDELDVLLKRWKKCQETGFWQCYPTGIKTLSLNTWAARRIDESLEETRFEAESIEASKVA